MVAVPNLSLFDPASVTSLTTLNLCNLCVIPAGSADARPIGVSTLAVSAIYGAISPHEKASQRMAGPAVMPRCAKKNGTIKTDSFLATYANRSRQSVTSGVTCDGSTAAA